MIDWPRVQVIREICLVKEVVSGRRVIICSKIQTPRNDGRICKHILVKLIVHGIVGAVSESESGIKLVLNKCIE